MRILTVVALAAVVGCSGGADGVSKAPTGDPSTSDPKAPTGDPTSADVATPTLYGTCDRGSVALTAGAITDAASGVTYRWPAGWTGLKDSNFGIWREHTYLPLGGAPARDTRAQINIYST